MIKRKKKETQEEISGKDELLNEDQSVDEKANDETTGNEQSKTEETKTETATSEKSPEEKYNEMYDKYIRLMAEYDNYRRRTLREKSDLIKSAGEDIIIGFLSVIDDFDRAMASINQASNIEGIKEGVELIYNKLSAYLKQRGVKEIESMNATFDSDHHEAIATVPTQSEEQKGKIIDVIQKGYMLNDKMIRIAKVVIGE